MKFSIVTPTRNNLQKLRQCVGSIRRQGDVDREHIVQDAVSTDGTDQWLRAQPDIRWKSEPDSGMYDAINRGWSQASGDVLSWLNGDEQYLPGTLAAVAEVFRKHPEVDLVYGNHIVVDGDGRALAARREVGLSRVSIANSSLNAGSCTMFFRRRLWTSGVLSLDTRYRFAADMDLVLRLLAAGHRWIHLPRYLALFTFDGSNLSCSPRMLEETDQVRARHGAAGHPLARKMLQIGRVGRRLFAGSYARADLEYDFCTDELGAPERMVCTGVGALYRTTIDVTMATG